VSLPAIPLDPLSFTAGAAAVIGFGLWIAARRPLWVVRYPRAVLAVLLVITLSALALLLRTDPPGLRLEIDPSTEPLLPAGDPAYDAYRRAVVDFGDDQIYVIAMESDDVFTHQNLSAMRHASDGIHQLDGVRSVKSLVKVTSFRYLASEDWIEVQPLIEEVLRDPAALAELRDRSVRDPLYRKTLVSEDGRAAALNVSFREMSDGDFIAADLDGRVRRILDEQAGDGRRFYVSGRPHIKSVMYHSMIRDLTLLIPVVSIFGLLAIGLRSLRIGLVAMVPNAIPVLIFFGLLRAGVAPLSLPTSLIGSVALGIAIDATAHYLVRYRAEREAGSTPEQAVMRCNLRVGRPIAVASLMLIVGFVSVTASEFATLREFGQLSAVTMAVCALTDLLLLPAILVRTRL
jgi:predicted RND superfamily exporter protein